MKNGWRAITLNNIPEAGCSKCTDGHVRTPKEEGIGWTSAPCGCLVERESLKHSKYLLSHSNIPDKFRKFYTLENWKEDLEVDFETIKKVLDAEQGNWLFLYGVAGVGKTYLSIIVAQIALLQEKSVYFSAVVDLLEDLRPDNPDKYTVLQKCKRADVLVLDDIGHEKSSQWVRERLYLIINDRWSNGKVIIFTSNFDIENLRTSISEAVYSRVKGESLEVHLESKQDRRIIK